MTAGTIGYAMLPWCLLYLPLAVYTCPWMAFTEALLHCIMGFLSGFLLLLSVSLATNGDIGGRDIKLVALLSIPFGTSGLMTALALSYLFFECMTVILLQLVL